MGGSRDVYKRHELIAILIAFSPCALLIKDERGGRRLSIRVCLNATLIAAACNNLYRGIGVGIQFLRDFFINSEQGMLIEEASRS